jgi:hypothetical protein
MNTTGGKQRLEGIVYELDVVIGLEGFDGEAELCGDISAKIGDVGCYLRFANEGKSPAKMRKTLEQNEVVLIT